MPAPVPAGAQTLGLQRETLADQRRIQRREVRGERGHAMLPAPHLHMPLPLRDLVTTRFPLRVGQRDRRSTGVVPLLRPGTIEIRQTLPQQPIRLPPLRRRQRRERAGGAIRIRGGDLAVREGGEHLRHIRHQTTPRRQRMRRGCG